MEGERYGSLLSEGDSSQGGRKLLMLFFSNPFLISGFGTRAVGEDKSGEREERRETKVGSKLIGGFQWNTMWCYCIHNTHLKWSQYYETFTVFTSQLHQRIGVHNTERLV